MSPGGREDLEAGILSAHVCGDSVSLARLYAVAAEAFAREGDTEREAFFLSHALVFALEAGVPEAEGFAGRLRAAGRHD